MNTRIYLEMIEESTKFIRKQTSIEPRAGVILGSGLSKATPDLEKRREIPYQDIPGFPKTNEKWDSPVFRRWNQETINSNGTG